MISATQLRKGMTIKIENDLFKILEVTHLTPGNKHGMIITKLRNLKDGTSIEYRFRSKDTVEKPYLEKAEIEYLYKIDNIYVLMKNDTWEQIHLSEEVLGDVVYYLVPNIKFYVELLEGNPVGIEPPKTVDLKVMSTEPNLKGATKASSTKPATLETGLVVQVPFFIEEGNIVRISTEDNSYLERAEIK